MHVDGRTSSSGQVFISYAREDAATVDRLVDALERRDVGVWLDRRSIAPGMYWDDELANAVDLSLAVISVVTDGSLRSEMCARELQRAVEGDKLIVPVRVGATTRQLPAALDERQWLEMANAEAAGAVAARLAALVSHDVEWLGMHASVLSAARLWQANPRRSHLLRGADLDAAVTAFASGSTRARPPRPIPLQMAFIEASRGAALGAPRGSMVGRADEITKVEDVLRDARLVSIVGWGGVGKTRLAREVALRAERSFGGNVYIVDLSPLRDAALVLPTIAASLGIGQAHRDELLRSIADHVGIEATLIVLDNFEHVLDARSDAAALMTASTSIRLLVTSRERLDLSHERLVSLEPLSAPDAFELLRERVADRFPDTTVPENTALRICGLVDRLPLAIELATARLDLLSPEQLAEALSDGRASASLRGTADADPRQASLEGLVAWSYELLDPPERAAFESFSVFRGGTTIETAQTVAALDLDVLGSLFRKSLIVRSDEIDGRPRFRMLETIRSFAQQRLSPDRREPLMTSLIDHLVEDGPGGPESLERIDWLEREIDNFRSCLAWAAEATSFAPFLRLFLNESMSLWIDRGRLVEGQRWCDVLVARLEEVPAPGRADVLGWAGEVALYRGDIARAVELKHRALADARVHEPDDLGVHLADLGRALALAGDAAAAYPFLEEALEARRRTGAPEGVSHAMAALAFARSFHDVPAAVSLYEEALALFDQAPSDRASWRQVQELEMRTEMALIHLRADDVGRSIEALHRALSLGAGERTMFFAIAIEALAAAASRCGDERTARQLAALAAVLRERTGLGLSELGSDDFRREIEAAAEPGEMERLRADVRSQDLDQIVAGLPSVAASLTSGSAI